MIKTGHTARYAEKFQWRQWEDEKKTIIMKQKISCTTTGEANARERTEEILSVHLLGILIIINVVCWCVPVISCAFHFRGVHFVCLHCCASFSLSADAFPLLQCACRSVLFAPSLRTDFKFWPKVRANEFRIESFFLSYLANPRNVINYQLACASIPSSGRERERDMKW